MPVTRRVRRRIAVVAVVLAAVGLAGAGTASVLAETEPTSSAASARVATSSGHAYFVDCSAPSAGDGSRAHPWAALAAVDAHGPFAPGDTIALRRGTICAGRLAPQGSGAPGRPIVLGAWGSGAKPVVEGGGTATTTGAVQLTDVHDWRVQDLTVTNRAAQVDDTYRAGILVVNASGEHLADIEILRNDVLDVTSGPWGAGGIEPHAWGGIVVATYPRADDARSSLGHVAVDGNRVTDVGRTGIVVWDAKWDDRFITDVTVSRNTVVRAEGDSIVLMGVDGGVIDGNVSRDGSNLPDCPLCSREDVHTPNAGIWPTESRNIRITRNEVSGEHATGGDGEGFDIDLAASHVVMEHNYAHDNEGGGVLICGAADSVIRDNVFQDDGGGEISFACTTPAERIVIEHNTIVTPEGGTTAVVRHAPGSGDVGTVFRDNVVVNRGTGGYDWGEGVTVASNTFDGLHPPTEPVGDDTLRDRGDLVAPGSGGAGLGSLEGYRLRPGAPDRGARVAVR